MIRFHLLVLLLPLALDGMNAPETGNLIQNLITITNTQQKSIRSLEATVNLLQRREVQRSQNELLLQRDAAPQKSHLNKLFVFCARAAIIFTIRESLLFTYKKVMPIAPVPRSYLRGLFDHTAEAAALGIGHQASLYFTVPGLKTACEKLLEYQTPRYRREKLCGLFQTAKNWFLATPVTSLHGNPIASDLIKKVQTTDQMNLNPHKPIDFDPLAQLPAFASHVSPLTRGCTGITLPSNQPQTAVLPSTHCDI